MLSHNFQLKSVILFITLFCRVCNIYSIALGFPCRSGSPGQSVQSGQFSKFGRLSRILCDSPATYCNTDTGKCQCLQNYPIPVFKAGNCLDYRTLGQSCLANEQCSQIEFSVCYKSIPIIKIESRLLNKYFNQIFTKGENRFGSCRCKDGYRQVGQRCYRSFIDVNCTTAYHCMQTDLNSHCDKTTNLCNCDPGYVYDTDVNQCRLTAKKFGQVCRYDKECQNWDPLLECRDKQCLCKKDFTNDYTLNRCKPLSLNIQNSPKKLNHFCPNGLRYDEKTDECQPIHYFYSQMYRQGEYRFFSVDKLLETIVIVIFCCVTIAFLRFWRYILPQNVICESQTGMFSDFSQTNRVQRRRTSRSNSVNRRGRVIQLRVNLESPEPQDLSTDLTVTLPLTASHSSLPPYELASNTPANSNNSQQPPPYGEEPPTYEEAMALFKIQK